jgi:hypothetical protein
LIALGKEADAARFPRARQIAVTCLNPKSWPALKSSTVGGGALGSVVTVQANLPLFDRGQPERASALACQSGRGTHGCVAQLLRADIAGCVPPSKSGGCGQPPSNRVGQQRRAIERIAQVSYDAGSARIPDLLDAYRTASSSVSDKRRSTWQRA